MSEQPQIKKIALIISVISAFLTPFMISGANISLPQIAKEFGLNPEMLSWTATIYLLTSAIFLVPLGKVGDIWGRKKLFGLGACIFAFSTLMCGFAPSIYPLLVYRAIEGIGSAMMFGTSSAIISSIFPANERGKVFGLSAGSVYLGLSLGPFIGGVIAQNLGWRYIFLLTLPVTLFVIYLVFGKLKSEWAEAKGDKFDYRGSLIYSLTIVLFLFGSAKISTSYGFYLIISAIIFCAIFILVEKRTMSPILDMNLYFGNRVFAFSNIAALINYCATNAVGFLLTLYLQYVKGLSPQSAGSILIAQPILMALISPFAGRFSDKIEPRYISSIGMAFTAIGLFLLSSLSFDSSISYIIMILCVFGFGFGFFSSPNTNAAMKSVERRFYGAASASIGTMRLLGQSLSMALVMIVFSLIIGSAKIVPEVYPQFLTSLKICGSIFGALCTIGIIFSFSRGKTITHTN